MGRRHKGRPVNGIVLLDKPSGVTSNRVLQQVKRLFGASKAGHTGSLDPLATGMLPICLGQATKVSGLLLDAPKRYEVSARFGVRTDTADADGEAIEHSDVRPDRAAIESVIRRFVGEIQQVPPMYSALKKDGARLYELARKGVEVERPARRVTIHELSCERSDGDTAAFVVHCSKGTYVRTLVEDLAGALGTLAHVTRLRRLSVGGFEDARLWTIEELTARVNGEDFSALDAVLLPVDAPLSAWPAVRLGSDAAHFYVQGQAVQAVDAPSAGHVRTYDHTGRFLGIGRAVGAGQIAPKRLFQ